MTDGGRGCREKAAHLSSLCQGDRGVKLSYSFAPLLALLLDSQLNPRQPSAPLSSGAGIVSESLDSLEIYIIYASWIVVYLVS